jgi:hypothetical protein
MMAGVDEANKKQAVRSKEQVGYATRNCKDGPCNDSLSFRPSSQNPLSRYGPETDPETSLPTGKAGSG